VGAADGIHPHLLEEAETEIPHRVGHGDSNPCMVLMIANPVDFEGLVVEIEACLGIEAKGAEATEVDVFIHDFSGLPENRSNLVEVRGIDRPKFGIPWGHRESGDSVLERQGFTIDRSLLDDSAVRIQKGSFDLNFLRLLGGVLKGDFDRDLPLRLPGKERFLGRTNGLGEDSVRGDVNGGTFGQPSVSVDSRSLVPPALLSIRVHPDGNGVEFVTESGQRGEIDHERSVSTPIPVNQSTVNPNGAVGRHPIELEFQMFAAIRGIEVEVTPIPTDSTGSISLGNIGFWVERCL
jgi:hypothetical protein